MDCFPWTAGIALYGALLLKKEVGTMKMTNIILGVLLLIQGLIIIIKPSSKPNFSISTVKVYKNLAVKEVATIIVKTKGTTKPITLEQSGKKWIIKEAAGYEADKSRIDEILTIIPNLSRATVASTNRKMFGNYYLGDKSSEYNVKFLGRDKKVLAELLIGKSVIKGTFVRKAGGDTIYRIPVSVAGFLHETPDEYMSTTNVNLPETTKRESIILSYGGEETVFIQSTPGGPTMGMDGKVQMKEAIWSVAGLDGKPEATSDSTKVKEFIASLDSVMFDSVEGKVVESKWGMKTPHLKITIKSKKGKTAVLKLGSLKDKSKDAPRYLAVSKELFIYGLSLAKYGPWEKKRSYFVKKVVEFDLSKISDMKMPDSKLKLNIPGVPGENAKKAVIYPSKSTPSIPANTPK
jgi:Domain of unknown function (DUF4340)